MRARARTIRMLAAAAMGLGLLTMAGASSRAHANPFLDLEGEAIDLRAEELELDVNAGKAWLKGKVALVRGDLKVSCPELELRYDDGPRLRFAKGSGGVRAELRGIRAEAPSIELDLLRNRLELHGGVRLTRGAGYLQAESATIDIATTRVSLKAVQGSIPVAAKKP